MPGGGASAAYPELMTETTDREDELLALIADGEGEQLEFKTSPAEQNEVIETLTASAPKREGRSY